MLSTAPSHQVVALFLGCHLVLQGQLTAENLCNFLFYVELVGAAGRVCIVLRPSSNVSWHQMKRGAWML